MNANLSIIGVLLLSISSGMSAEIPNLAAIPSNGFESDQELSAFYEKNEGKEKGNSITRSKLGETTYYFCCRHAALGGAYEELTVFRRDGEGKIEMICQFPFGLSSYEIASSEKEIVVTVYRGQARKRIHQVVFKP